MDISLVIVGIVFMWIALAAIACGFIYCASRVSEAYGKGVEPEVQRVEDAVQAVCNGEVRRRWRDKR